MDYTGPGYATAQEMIFIIAAFMRQSRTRISFKIVDIRKLNSQSQDNRAVRRPDPRLCVTAEIIPTIALIKFFI